MKERPIIFRGPMVRAILELRKTHTRRTRRLDAINEAPDEWTVSMHNDFEGVFYARFESKIINELVRINSPYGKPEDGVWVRETFSMESTLDYHGEQEEPPPGTPIQKHDDTPVCDAHWLIPHYRATEPDVELQSYDQSEEDWDRHGTRWTPSIFMPRWASRITLEIVDIRVERLQDISEADAIAEGIDINAPLNNYGTGSVIRDAYAALWDSINSKKHPWSSNPWAWVIEFKPV